MIETKIYNIRASQDGHEYHEAWTAHKALHLLLPIDKLIGIAGDQIQSPLFLILFGRHLS